MPLGWTVDEADGYVVVSVRGELGLNGCPALRTALLKCLAEQPDVLLVDGFSADGLPARLGSDAFYEACRRRLSEDGVLVANLVTDEPDFHRYLRSLREVFAGAVALAPSEGSPHNVTVFAWKGTGGLPSHTAMLDRACALQARHAVNLHATATRIEYGKGLNWDRRGQAG